MNLGIWPKLLPIWINPCRRMLAPKSLVMRRSFDAKTRQYGLTNTVLWLANPLLPCCRGDYSNEYCVTIGFNHTPTWKDSRSITVKDKTGREIKGHLDVALVNDKGQGVVRASYNLNPKSKRAAFAAFYLNQEQMDVFKEGGEQWILNAPANPSRWGYK